MRLVTKFSPKLALGISVVLGLYNCSVFVSGVPQWVWNPEANSAPISQSGGGGSSGNKVSFSGQNSDKEKIPLEIVDTQARLFPQILSAISNSLNGGHRPGSGGSSSSSSSSSAGGSGSSSGPHYPVIGGGGGSSSSGGSNGGSHGGSNNGGTSASCTGGQCTTHCSGSATGLCVGSAIASQAIDQGSLAGNNIASNPSVFGNFLQNFFGGNGGASTLPASIGGINGIGSIGSNKDPGGSCTCVDSNSCFLPSKPTGNCDGGSRVRCCSTTRGTRTYFPDEENRLSSVRTVTRSQIRRQLFRNIVRGSGSLLDDTLDLVLQPFLTKEDQLKIATRLLEQ